MVVRVGVSSELLAWARERSGLPADELVRRYPKLDEWQQGVSSPTLKQLERFAATTHTPVGYLFLAQPPDEALPVPDFRTFADEAVGRPSPDLLHTIFDCERRQEWYRDYGRANSAEGLVVGSFTPDTNPATAAAAMRDALAFGVDNRGSSWSDAFRRLAEHAEELGILVMVNGVVRSNTHRKLDPHEFRGFALVDAYAPVVFVNGADTKAAQVFTLAHELAHVWLGRSGIDNPDPDASAAPAVERWCNETAAELLVPAADLGAQDAGDTTETALDHLAARYRVSTLVVLRRLLDIGTLDLARYRQRYTAERDRLLALLAESGGTGGNFYNTHPVRTSKRFARALLASTLEGQTLYRDAFQMLGFTKHSTFDEFAQRLGVA